MTARKLLNLLLFKLNRFKIIKLPLVAGKLLNLLLCKYNSCKLINFLIPFYCSYSQSDQIAVSHQIM